MREFSKYQEYCRAKHMPVPEIDQRTRLLADKNTLYIPLDGQLFPDTTEEQLRSEGFDVIDVNE